MKLYDVLIHCSHFSYKVDDEKIVGFYSNCRVEAEDEEAAGQLAKDLFKNSQKFIEFTNDIEGSALLEVETVKVISRIRGFFTKRTEAYIYYQ